MQMHEPTDHSPERWADPARQITASQQASNLTGRSDWASGEHWAVARVFSKRAERLLDEIQKLGCGTAMPTYKRGHYRAGKLVWSKRPVLPGYLFIKLGDEDRGRVAELEGVYSFLTGGARAMARLDAEMPRFELGALMGDGNDVQAPPAERRVRRRRRPRPGKRYRMRMRQMQPSTGA